MTDTGTYAHVLAKRSAMVSRMSPAARHLAFPKLYARPVVVEEPTMLGKPEAALCRPLLCSVKPPVLPITPAPKLKPRWPKSTVPTKEKVDASRLQIDEIIRVCEARWEISSGSIVTPSHRRRYTMPRFAAMKLLRELLKLSMPAIGLALGNRDHTTALSGYKRANDLHMTDCDWRARYEAALIDLTSTEPSFPNPLRADCHRGDRARSAILSPVASARTSLEDAP